MTPDEPTTIVGSEVSSHTAYVVPGSIMVACADCAKPAYVSPSAFEILAEPETTVICDQCFKVRLDAKPADEPITLREPSQKTIDELKAWRSREP